MLGFAQSTVSKYMARTSKLPSQPWKTFLRNHAEAIAAIDVCVVPTLSFDLLFVFLVLGHGRRWLLWFEVTRHPTAETITLMRSKSSSSCVDARWASAESRALSGGIKKAPPMLPLQGALLDPIDIEQALRE
jgi:hypothetical protein